MKIFHEDLPLEALAGSNPAPDTKKKGEESPLPETTGANAPTRIKKRYKVMKSITRKQIPVLLKKIAGRAAKNDGLTWTVTIGPNWDGQERIRVSVSDEKYRTEHLFEAAVTEESRIFGLLLEMHINAGLDKWRRENEKKEKGHGEE